MSIKVMDRVWEHSKATGTPLLVLLCLADWADDNGECWPSISAIKRKCRLRDERHVQRVIHETLEKKLGEVVVVVGGGKSSRRGGVRSNLYVVTVHLLAEPQTPAEGPPSSNGDPGSQTTPDPGPSTTPDGGSQTTLTPVPQPPEPSLTHQGDPSAGSVHDDEVGGQLTRAANEPSTRSSEEPIPMPAYVRSGLSALAGKQTVRKP